LLAIGGDLRAERLLLAYRSGIFPWFNQTDPICWWSPNPRYVLFPAQLKVSKSMQKVLKKETFQFSTNKDFEKVINACSRVPRNGQYGTWITSTMREAYIHLHQLGYAHSAEAWLNDELVGGLYGIRLGKVFFGESMFSVCSNASKFAFISYVQQLQKEDVQLIDCQLHTKHLESLGASMIPRKNFIQHLKQWIPTI
ncbi:MAG: leucyl/phenylalanyl-tRNA--protein transferase, partial [Ferruginibacter sp.]